MNSVTAYVARYLLPERALKRKIAVFRLKVHFYRKNSATKLNIVSSKVVKQSLAYLSVQTVAGGRLLLSENLAETDPPPSKRRFTVNIRS